MSKQNLIVELGGVSVEGIREIGEMEFEAIFDAALSSVQPTITNGTFRLTKSANTKLLQLFSENPINGPDFVPKITRGSLTKEDKYYIDWRDGFKRISDVESEVTIKKDHGAPSMLQRAAGVSMELLKQKGVLNTSDWTNVPYVTDLRNRGAEFIQMQVTLVQTTKAIYDEVFKLVNIISDIASGGAVINFYASIIALINLLTSITQLVVLTVQMVKLFLDIQKTFFPGIRYHKGVNFINYLQKGLNYLGYDVEFDTETRTLLERIDLLGSKNDEIGKQAIWVELDPFFLPDDEGDGLLNPADYGYTLGEAIDLAMKLTNSDIAIDDSGTVQIRTKKSLYWYSTPSYTMPNVLIEEALNYQNGYSEYNYDELISRTLIQFEKDRSDYHTLTDTNNRMSEVIWTYDGDTNPKRSAVRGIKEVNIPYALCVRKPKADNLFTKLVDIENIFNSLQSGIDDAWSLFDDMPTIAGLDPIPPKPEVAKFSKLLLVRAGALLVENHWFDVPKLVYLDPVSRRIPFGFENFIGADRIYTQFYKWDSLAYGDRDPFNPEYTNQKQIFRGVKIPFTLTDWEKTIDNSWFTTSAGERGRFLQLNWNEQGDYAIADFYLERNWVKGITGTLYQLGPEKTEVG